MNRWKQPAAWAVAMGLAAVLLAGCRNGTAIGPGDLAAPNPGAASTDKAVYAPGDTVRFHLSLDPAAAGNGTLLVRYKSLNRVVDERKLPLKGRREIDWAWKPPAGDGIGYMAEMFVLAKNGVSAHGNIAVDVSSDWARYPRYGYLADFGRMDAADQKAVVDRLNRYHIDGIQFYDWQWKHHRPLPMENGKPADSWPDIANRTTELATVKRYINLAHGRSMKAMNYNLLYGASGDSERDGVKIAWGLFKDPLHEEQDVHPLPAGWNGPLKLMDPGNPEWRRYLLAAEANAFRQLGFDGWHVDQLGDRGARWNGEGKSVNLAAAYAPFLQEAERTLGVPLVMNAVGQYGQGFIAAKAPVSFLYTEVWDGTPRYADLKGIIDRNEQYGKGKLATVLAAYMDYDRAKTPGGAFNEPGVLLADAVIFASGGAHIELGEGMLDNEYFPNRNLQMNGSLERKLTRYYDFLTAYERILRGHWPDRELRAKVQGNLRLSDDAEPGAVWAFAKSGGDRDIVHLINLSDARDANWRDPDGTRREPDIRRNVTLTVDASRKVTDLWMASPDMAEGSALSLPFEQADGKVTVALPQLQYWDMVVLEYEKGE